MTFTAFIFIAASIVLHGSWHFLCKSSGKVSMAFFALFSSSLFVSMLPWALCSGVLFDLPGNVLWYAFWGAFSGAMCNFGLMLAYRSSDISLAYPMARALPVFLTMAGTSLFGWGKALSGPAIAGMIIIFSGCVCMALTNGKMSSRREKIAAIKKGFLGILIASLGTTGYTIIDFSTVVAAPSACRTLADLGARVIKVESRTGDATRYQDALPTLKPESYCFTNCNANKEYISVNIKLYNLNTICSTQIFFIRLFNAAFTYIVIKFITLSFKLGIFLGIYRADSSQNVRSNGAIRVLTDTFLRYGDTGIGDAFFKDLRNG